MGVTLFLDLIAKILVLLPVKSLLRFRCVSKSWRAMIDDDDFIKTHLQRSLKTNTNLHVLLSRWSLDDHLIDRTNVYSISHDEAADDTMMIQVHNPLICGNIRSSCNGLLWLSNCHHHHDEAIWNPFTSKYRRFSSTTRTLNLDISSPILSGFGHDRINNDYKVVSVLHKHAKYQWYREHHDPPSQVWVYSLRLNSWKRVEDFPYEGDRFSRQRGKFINGALHWFVKTRHDESLVVFDLVLENFSLLPFPHELVGCNKFLDVVGGCLVICVDRDMELGGLWMMKEYGVTESWIKLCSMRDIFQGSSHVQLVARTNLRERHLLPRNALNINFSIDNGENLISYSMKEETGRVVSFREKPCNFNVTMCLESLTPI